MGVPSTLGALHHEVDMLGAGGDLCRVRGAWQQQPQRMRTSCHQNECDFKSVCLCVWWCGLLSSVPNSHSKHGHKSGRVPVINPRNLCHDVT